MATERVPINPPRIRWRKARPRTPAQLAALRARRADLKAQNLAQRALIERRRPEPVDVLEAMGLAKKGRAPS